jgi:hypothetical protein
MRDLRRVVFLGVLVTGMGVGCRPTGERNVCPERMQLVKERSAPGKAIWCKSKDGKTARWYQYHPGDPPQKRRQSCGYTDGKPDGKFAAWHPAGQPWIEGAYEKGIKVGTWTQWDKDGSKVAEGAYRSNKLVAGAPVAMAAICDTLKP